VASSLQKNMQKINEFLLECEENNSIDYDISHRGGHYGLNAESVVNFLFEKKDDATKEKLLGWLPSKIGAFCNYLGGGLRGSINGRGNYDELLPSYAKDLIDKFAQCCKERYLEIENASGLNEEEDENGETNWDAVGSNRCRFAGVASAF
jgi:hypothetical protein